MRSIRIAAVIFNAPRNRTRENLDRMDGWVAAARKEGATIVCFPELNITGYGADQGIRDSAEPLPGGTGERLCALAERHQMVILAGLAENGEAGKVFSSHLVVTPTGILGIYRKLHIAPPEKTTCRVPLRAGGDVEDLVLGAAAHLEIPVLPSPASKNKAKPHVNPSSEAVT